MTLLVRIAAFCLSLFAAGAAFAQNYPNHNVRIIVPFAAGGPTDVMARLIAQKLSEKFGQPFVIENHGGAGGNIGMGNAARAPGDGYTILFVSSSYVVNPSLYNKIPYDPDKDFLPVTKAAAATHALLVHPSVSAKSVKELVDLIKADPRSIRSRRPAQAPRRRSRPNCSSRHSASTGWWWCPSPAAIRRSRQRSPATRCSRSRRSRPRCR